MKKVYETKEALLLWELGYRLDAKGSWRLEIDGSCGLTAHEQAVNGKGGRDMGGDTSLIVSREIAATARMLDGYSEEEIASSPSLKNRAAWLERATA